ncbi:CDP-glucose 4,6-dehydratase [Bacillus clarus]|uniref:CDP-glucose 4,6-dehydratase n=1 Tax=Bacillus clarus TaxID=2338372 RepID=A0A090YUP8_9BACI|nr:CDP-glucose 4,6-dehydratase [Bacillus clarus]KFN01997.1 CDP-glucose 4,6-dehydratase [Bacillus clarus]RFT65104.1 CDP-glucose 4,6-dehydratase [Bacillus clarus]
MATPSFWHKKKVFITGHTGFKGTWLTLYLTSLGAEVTGYSSHSPSTPYLFEQSKAAKECHTMKGDITDYHSLLQAAIQSKPDVIFHLAAQPLVTTSYNNPIETFKTNVLGTVHVLEVAKHVESVRIIINVTSDKCYENDGTGNRAFHENDRLGGHDPYSASKACAELVATSYQKSFFHSNTPNLASVRAGNVIGGGDWAENRLFPDIIRAYMQGSTLYIRNSNAIRPWQHVLDPLNGYVLLAERLWDNTNYGGAWNFGPIDQPHMTVNELIQIVVKLWNKKLSILSPTTSSPYESPILTLDSSKSMKELLWIPKLSTAQAISWTIDWYQNYVSGKNMEPFTRQQISAFKNL